MREDDKRECNEGTFCFYSLNQLKTQSSARGHKIDEKNDLENDRIAPQNIEYCIRFLCKSDFLINFMMIKKKTCINTDYTFLAEMLHILLRQSAR